jgi:hypothetical protein
VECHGIAPTALGVHTANAGEVLRHQPNPRVTHGLLRRVDPSWTRMAERLRVAVPPTLLSRLTTLRRTAPGGDEDPLDALVIENPAGSGLLAAAGGSIGTGCRGPHRPVRTAPPRRGARRRTDAGLGRDDRDAGCHLRPEVRVNVLMPVAIRIDTTRAWRQKAVAAAVKHVLLRRIGELAGSWRGPAARITGSQRLAPVTSATRPSRRRASEGTAEPTTGARRTGRTHGPHRRCGR